MEIREATETDIPEILMVLKASLGEISSKKTEEVWKYKHLANPFGKSLVLIAVENGNVIGVRALMRWKWQLGQNVFSALRAVDTATHPDHQGKGVFKKLTLKAIEIAQIQENDFIFNTPNNQSLPGYLKMGWQRIDNLKVRIMPGNILNRFNKSQPQSYLIENNSSDEDFGKLVSKYNILKGQNNKIFTPKSAEYLKWRYYHNPLQNYEIIRDENFFLAGYIKEHKYFKEFRITEHIFIDEEGLQNLKLAIKSISKKYTAIVITSSEINSRLAISGNFGPILTIRNLNLINIVKFQKLQSWNYTLGDLELF
jgi:N-acetylglutamate synthase-like GNAT family acetyltransferase